MSTALFDLRNSPAPLLTPLKCAEAHRRRLYDATPPGAINVHANTPSSIFTMLLVIPKFLMLLCIDLPTTKRPSPPTEQCKAKCLETGEQVAIKKVLQDKRYKNRELQIMRLLDHPSVVQLKHCFYSTTEKDEVYLNLVLEFVPETVYRALKHYTKAGQHMPMLCVQLYSYQICRSLNYIHNVIGVCHRDIKPQNLLVNTQTLELKLCDFGSAKQLVPGEPNISYICSRYYRAPELIFGATEYTTAIDMWSVGCVMAELLLGQPLFPGESGVDQLVEIIKILGTPTREEIKCMNPNYTEFKFPQIKAHPWHKVFHKRMPAEAVDLVSRLLQYSPNLRCSALEACAHPFFDDLRDPNTCLSNGRPLPPLFNFTPEELAKASPELRQRLIPQPVQK